MDRRNFLHAAAGSALVAFQTNAIERAAAAARSVKDQTPIEVARDEDFWTEIRNSFTVDRNVINLNNGYVSPAPLVVQDAMRRYLDFTACHKRVSRQPWRPCPGHNHTDTDGSPGALTIGAVGSPQFRERLPDILAR